MFIRRRRPLLGAAMIGGTAYMAGKAGQRAAYREASQEQRIGALEQDQVVSAPAATAAPDLAGQLATLGAMVEKGTLSQAEFEAAKQKLLAG